jgi:glycosyltransferase involved in cell wall biosynthesis
MNNGPGWETPIEGVCNLRRIVVVVPAHDERERLSACLASIKAASARVDLPVTVVVVLDSCTDNSAEVVPSWVHTIGVSARNVGVARAAGFKAVARCAGADAWLASTDADSIVPPNWLLHHQFHYRTGAPGVVGTVCVDWQHHTRATRLSYQRLYNEGDRSVHGHVHGANLGVRADAYWQVGGFSPLRVGEDVDVVASLLAARYALVWETRNPVRTSDRRDCRVRGGFGDYLRHIAEASAAIPVADV